MHILQRISNWMQHNSVQEADKCVRISKQASGQIKSMSLGKHRKTFKFRAYRWTFRRGNFHWLQLNCYVISIFMLRLTKINHLMVWHNRRRRKKRAANNTILSQPIKTSLQIGAADSARATHPTKLFVWMSQRRWGKFTHSEIRSMQSFGNNKK